MYIHKYVYTIAEQWGSKLSDAPYIYIYIHILYTCNYIDKYSHNTCTYDYIYMYIYKCIYEYIYTCMFIVADELVSIT